MSILITANYQSKWTKAIEKAKTVKPRVKVIGFGQFQVQSSDKTTWYTVTFTQHPGTRKLECSCSCKSQKGSNPRPCYHCPACALFYKWQLLTKSRAQSAAAPKQIACRACLVEYEAEDLDSTGLCPECINEELFG